jgi:hypothetical protein
LLKNYQELELNRENLLQKCTETQSQARYVNKIFKDEQIMESYRHLIHLKLQEKLLSVAQCLGELKSNRNHLRVPYLINRILTVAPKALPPDSQIFLSLKATVNEIKAQMLSEFHSSFEAHLLKSEELISESDRKLMSWSEFLSTARELIVAYSMVSILPSYFQDSNHKLCIEAYKDCLDSAFTPLWGRFHFHLGAARDSGSKEQILWTFEYSKSFLGLLSELCGSITSSSPSNEREQSQGGKWEEEGDGGLHQMLSPELMIAFRLAAMEQIVEKSCRFLRAHVAECISSLSESALPLFVTSLLDCSLDLDAHFCGLLEETVQRGSINSTPPPPISYSLPVSIVFADHSLCRSLWLSADADHFKNALLMASRPPQFLTFGDEHLLPSLESDTSYEKNFSFHLNVISSSSSDSSDSSSNPSFTLSSSLISTSSSSSSRCYICVYECLYLFQLTCQRYAFLNRTSYDSFISHVMEPILLTLLGFLWFYKRMNPQLRELDTKEVLPFYLRSAQKMEEYCGFLDTVKYVKELFRQLESSFIKFICLKSTVTSRLERLLKLLKQWIVEMTRGTRYQYFTLEDLVTKVFVLCEQSRIREQQMQREDHNPMVGETSDLRPLIDCVVSQLDGLVEELKQKVKIAERKTKPFVF